MAKENRPVRVAVDAMGGDHAPSELVAGAVEAARHDGVQIMLVGDPERVEAELVRLEAQDLPIKTIPSEGVILEGESPVLALRQKPRASVLVATSLLKEGHADACVTMGSTGAAMAAAAVILGVIKGIDRPALGGPVVGLAPNTVILDVGTNVDCRPSQLLGFAVIGDVFARQLWGIEKPRVAILSVGAEAGKGNRQVKEATELLEKSGLNFIGNIEADDIPHSKAEVVVCDGFVGNIVMKLTEGIGRALVEHLRSNFSDSISAESLDRIAKEVFEINNTAETRGGGPLFGVNGVSIVGHGAAKAEAVRKAIGMAKMVVESGFITKLNEELAEVHSRAGE
ncbi:MAG: phosphate acyltransferase PlsX [Chloroflexi bacterium]|nr:phosphate acyltransferase PlsX [Chloroflexota bacterium]